MTAVTVPPSHTEAFIAQVVQYVEERHFTQPQYRDSVLQGLRRYLQAPHIKIHRLQWQRLFGANAYRQVLTSIVVARHMMTRGGPLEAASIKTLCELLNEVCVNVGGQKEHINAIIIKLFSNMEYSRGGTHCPEIWVQLGEIKRVFKRMDEAWPAPTCDIDGMIFEHDALDEDGIIDDIGMENATLLDLNEGIFDYSSAVEVSSHDPDDELWEFLSSIDWSSCPNTPPASPSKKCQRSSELFLMANETLKNPNEGIFDNNSAVQVSSHDPDDELLILLSPIDWSSSLMPNTAPASPSKKRQRSSEMFHTPAKAIKLFNYFDL